MPVAMNRCRIRYTLLSVTVFLVFVVWHKPIGFALPSSSKSIAVSHALVALGLCFPLSACIGPALADEAGTWDYAEKGLNWEKDHPICGGKSQTPIDLKDSLVAITEGESLTKLLDYRPQDVSVLNNGRGLQVNAGFGIFRLPDGVYEAKQFHFHFPSEHEINGKLAAGEMHIVHQKRGSSGTDDLAVIGIFLKHGDVSEGPEGIEIKKLGILGYMPQFEGATMPIGKFDLNAFKSEFGGGFFHYKGSLTTPPCSETVHWYVLKRGAPVDDGIIDGYTALFKPNNRGIMPLNDRSVVASLVAMENEYSTKK